MLTIAHDHLNNRVHIDDTKSAFEYFCPLCGSPLDTKKGPILRHHFAHKPHRDCTDTWHGTYSDTEWHFSWQERYPRESRERMLQLGETRHRADVIVGTTVIEFQHSALPPTEFNDRNTFYADLGYKVIWLYDLRGPYESGAIASVGEPDSTSFRWDNPRKSFNAYDIATGTADLFFQLRDDDGAACIVQVSGRSPTGFEEFTTRRWLTADEFLAFTGAQEGGFAPPCMKPLEPNEDYLRFKKRYSIKLNPQQERAVQTVDGPTLLLAVPGSGKTTVMVARIGYLVLERHVPPKSIVAITYNRAAATEMRERFAMMFGDRRLANEIEFRTINSLCHAICADWYRRHNMAMPGVIDEKGGRQAGRRKGKKRLLKELYHEITDEWPSERERIEIENAITLIKNSRLGDEHIADVKPDMPSFREVYERYQSYLRANGLMDFDDQMIRAEEFLKDGSFLESWRNKYRYWCVDEAQDTSLLQHVLIYNLSTRGGAGNLFMVGEEDQSIYGFRGARPTALLNFKFNYRNALVLKLERNYRSGEEIVGAASSFVGRCTGRFEKRIVSDRGPGSTVRVVDVPTRMGQYGKVHEIVQSHDSEKTLAILYRDNETGIPLVDELDRDRTPFQLLSKANTFFTSSVVLDIRAFMTLAREPRNEKAFKRIYYKAEQYIGKRDAEWACTNARREGIPITEALVDQMSSFRKKGRMRSDKQMARRFASLIEDVASLPPLDAIDRIMEGGYRDWLYGNAAAAHHVDLLRRLATREDTTSSFLERLDRLNAICSKDPAQWKPEKLVLSTAHSSKGREFDSVLIVDAVDGTFPSVQEDPTNRSKDEASNYQEERRLFYVAMTRAKDELTLMRPVDEDTPFVDEIIPRPISPSQEKVVFLKEPTPTTKPPDSQGGISGTTPPTQTTQPKPTSKAKQPQAISRYDISTWRTKGWDINGGHLVTNGSMDAMLTRTDLGQCADMTVDFYPKMLWEMVGHFEEMTKGYVEATLCLDAHVVQDAGLITVEELADEHALIRVSQKVAAEVLPPIQALLDDGAELSLTYRNESGSASGKHIESLDPNQQIIFLSGNLFLF